MLCRWYLTWEIISWILQRSLPVSDSPIINFQDALRTWRSTRRINWFTQPTLNTKFNFNIARKYHMHSLSTVKPLDVSKYTCSDPLATISAMYATTAFRTVSFVTSVDEKFPLVLLWSMTNTAFPTTDPREKPTTVQLTLIIPSILVEYMLSKSLKILWEENRACYNGMNIVKVGNLENGFWIVITNIVIAINYVFLI